MPRPRSRKVAIAKEKLVMRILSGHYVPGDRFFSNRWVAQQFGVSYQTAHRLLTELREEGWLERRPFSGSYINGPLQVLSSVTLHFAERAKRPHSFGAHVSALLADRLTRERIPWKMAWGDNARTKTDSIPVLWECPGTLKLLARERRFSVLVNAKAPAGSPRSFVDSVSVDDFSGGVSAGELIAGRLGQADVVAVLAGPAKDPRNRERIAGFTSIVQNASIFSAKSWDFEDGYRIAAKLLGSEPKAVFCCNDRLASALITFGDDTRRKLPPIVGFDNAPVSESLNLTTIAIPWEELVDRIVGIVKNRIAGDTSASIQYAFNPLPVVRDMFFR